MIPFTTSSKLGGSFSHTYLLTLPILRQSIPGTCQWCWFLCSSPWQAESIINPTNLSPNHVVVQNCDFSQIPQLAFVTVCCWYFTPYHPTYHFVYIFTSLCIKLYITCTTPLILYVYSAYHALPLTGWAWQQKSSHHNQWASRRRTQKHWQKSPNHTQINSAEPVCSVIATNIAWLCQSICSMINCFTSRHSLPCHFQDFPLYYLVPEELIQGSLQHLVTVDRSIIHSIFQTTGEATFVYVLTLQSDVYRVIFTSQRCRVLQAFPLNDKLQGRSDPLVCFQAGFRLLMWLEPTLLKSILKSFPPGQYILLLRPQRIQKGCYPLWKSSTHTFWDVTHLQRILLLPFSVSASWEVLWSVWSPRPVCSHPREEKIYAPLAEDDHWPRSKHLNVIDLYLSMCISPALCVVW